MPLTYPPLAPTLSGDTLTISRFLNNPALVQRRLRTLAEQMYVADVLLTGRVEATGGAIAYGISESIYTDRAPEAVNPGAEYPRALAGTPAAAMVTTSKWGQDVRVTDEEIGRTNMQAVNRAMLKVVNRNVDLVDGIALTAISAAVTQTQAAAFAWSSGSADPFLDVELAKAQVFDLAQGYDPDTIVLTSTLYARLVANQKVMAGLARESSNTVTTTGEIKILANLAVRPVPAARMPGGMTVCILDSAQLGAIGYERIPSPEYSGDPANGLESFTRRDPDANDSWLIRGRRPIAPFVQEPACAVKITGA
jgi:hypothetical protein